MSFAAYNIYGGLDLVTHSISSHAKNAANYEMSF